MIETTSAMGSFFCLREAEVEDEVEVEVEAEAEAEIEIEVEIESWKYSGIEQI